ncbi:MAG: ATP-binding protein [Candidatus Brocadiia bacterium]
MFSNRGSISLRLAVGFALVLAVLALALVLTLHHLGKVRQASERLTTSLEVRRQAVRIRAVAEELAASEPRLLGDAGLDWDVWEEFRRQSQQLAYMVEPIRGHQLEEPEQSDAGQMAAAIATLRSLLGEKAALEAASRGVEVPAELEDAEFRPRVKELIERIRRLSGNLADAFEVRTLQAADQAQTTWTISMAISQIVFPIALLLSLLVVYYTHRSIVRPLDRLVDKVRALAEGDLSQRIEVEGSGEFTEVAESFNQMAQALEANQRQLVEAEKLASVGRLAAGVAHEINNPLTVITGYTRMLMNRLGEDSPEAEQLRNITEEIRQCKGIVSNLMDLSRPPQPESDNRLNPSELLTEVLGMAQVLDYTEGIRIEEAVIDRQLVLDISRARLRQLLLNIVRNALEVLQDGPGGLLHVQGYVRPRDKVSRRALAESFSTSQAFLVFVFADNGPGIEPEHLDRLFEPFFTTKADGMGLGLAICYNIARAHGGFIEVQSQAGEGTTFTVGLPLAEEGP